MHGYEKNCVGCDVCTKDCQRFVKTCDKCFNETEKLYDSDGMELCCGCLEDAIKKAISKDKYFISDFFDEICEYLEIEEVEE